MADKSNQTIKNNTSPTPVTPKKRGRKRTKKRYFTEDTEAAIAEYLASTNQDERDEIFKDRIYYAFYKLAENLIHTFILYFTIIITIKRKNKQLMLWMLIMMMGYYVS